MITGLVSELSQAFKLIQTVLINKLRWKVAATPPPLQTLLHFRRKCNEITTRPATIFSTVLKSHNDIQVYDKAFISVPRSNFQRTKKQKAQNKKHLILKVQTGIYS